MEDDLKYPAGLIASPHWTRERSLLSVGRGSMPGLPLQPIIDNGLLIAGRGLIPGNTAKIKTTLGLVKHKKYPNYSTYRGRANKGSIGFHVVRVPYLTTFVNWLVTEVIEAKVWAGRGEMLELKIWANEKSWWGIIPTNEVIVEWSFYIRGAALGERRLIEPITIFAAIVAVLAIVALIFLFKEIKEIIWGPPEKEALIPSLTTLLLVGGGLALAGILLIPKRRKK